MADWSVEALLLRLIEFDLRGANWQRGGGKGKRPKVIDLPDGKAGGKAKASGPDVAAKLRNLGLIPAGGNSSPPGPSAAEFAQRVDDDWLARQERLANDS